LTDHDNNLALAVLVLHQPPIAPVLFPVGWLHVATKICAVHFNLLALAAELVALYLRCHRLTQLVSEHESRLVLATEIAGERQSRLALHLVAEDRDGGEISAQRELVKREKCVARQAEILAARHAAEPESAGRAARLIAGRTATVRAHRLAVRVSPANRREHRLGLALRQPQHFRQGERLGAS